MSDFYGRYQEEIRRAIYCLLFVLCVYIFVTYLFAFIAPFAAGFLLAMLLEPLMGLLIKKCGMNRTMAALLGTTAVLVLVGGLGATVSVRIWEQAREFLHGFPGYMENAGAAFGSVKNRFSDFFQLIPPWLGVSFDDIAGSLTRSVTSIVTSMVRENSVGVVRQIPDFVMNVVLCLLSTFFFMKDKELIRSVFVRRSPKGSVRTYKLLKKGLLNVLGGYMRAQFTIMTVIACINVIWLAVLRYPYALFIGLVIALLDAIPLIGSGLVLWPWLFMSLLGGDLRMAAGLLGLYIVNLITRQLMEPKILGSQIGLHPLVTLMSMYIGLKVFGFLGFVIGPVIVIVIKTYYLYASSPVSA